MTPSSLDNATIDDLLVMLFETTEERVEWMMTLHPLLEHRRPLYVLRAGEGERVRAVLRGTVLGRDL